MTKKSKKVINCIDLIINLTSELEDCNYEEINLVASITYSLDTYGLDRLQNHYQEILLEELLEEDGL